MQGLGQYLFGGLEADDAGAVLLGRQGLNRVVGESRSGSLVKDLGEERLSEGRPDVRDAGEDEPKRGGRVPGCERGLINLLPGSRAVDE